MGNAELYKKNCQFKGETFDDVFYQALLKGDIEREKRLKQTEDLYKKIYTNSNIESDQDVRYVYRAHPDSMDETLATILYVFVMLFGSIFHGRVLVWIISTIIFINFKTGHRVKKEK